MLKKYSATSKVINQITQRYKTTIVKSAAIRSSLDDPWATQSVNPEVRETVRKVLAEIQEEGDVAVARYAQMYEKNVRPDNDFRLTEKEITKDLFNFYWHYYFNIYSGNSK